MEEGSLIKQRVVKRYTKSQIIKLVEAYQKGIYSREQSFELNSLKEYIKKKL